MTDNFNTDQHTGWESVWAGGDIPPRFQSFAEPEARVVAWIATVPPYSFILDVGCGVGRHVMYLGGRGFQMAGVDISPTGVRLAQEACAERLFSFDGRISDMISLPWADNTFDAALSIATIHHHRRARIVKALDEINRVLKPGRLFLVDFPCTSTIVYQDLRRQCQERTSKGGGGDFGERSSGTSQHR